MSAPDFVLTRRFPVPPERVYEAWLSGKEHTAMTGAPATSEPVVHGEFTAWGGYIEGSYEELEPGKRIVMAWRTSEFGAEDDDAIVTVALQPEGAGTLLTLTQQGSPAGQAERYRVGWDEYYFVRMAAYFG